MILEYNCSQLDIMTSNNFLKETKISSESSFFERRKNLQEF